MDRALGFLCSQGSLLSPGGSAWPTLQWLNMGVARALPRGGQGLHSVLSGAFAEHQFSQTRALLYPSSQSVSSA